jgi:hypothetical protein
MTAPQPATPGSDSVRAQIADRLAMWDSDRAERIANVLLPLVDRLRAEAKAEALEQFSVSLAERRLIYTASRGSYRKASQLAWDSAQTLRAAAYRTNPSSEETQR